MADVKFEDWTTASITAHCEDDACAWEHRGDWLATAEASQVHVREQSHDVAICMESRRMVRAAR